MTAVNKVNLAYAYACAVKAHQDFAEKHSSVEGATMDFELIHGVRWCLQGNDYVAYTKNPKQKDPDNFDYGLEVNWIEYEDEKYLHVDADDGCGNRHIQLVFLKSEEVKEPE